LGCFSFGVFLIDFFFAISSFNIGFIENWVSWFFLLLFYMVILVLRLGSRVWQVCLSWLELFFWILFAIWFFFQIHLLILIWLSIEFHNFFFTYFSWTYFNFITRDKLTQITCLKIIKIQIILQNNFKEIQMRVQEFWKAWITLNDFFKIYKYI